MESEHPRLLCVTAQPAPGLVSQLVTVRLLTPAGDADAQVGFGYDPAEPYSVRFSLRTDTLDVRREVARCTIARGIAEPVSAGDISLSPGLTEDGLAVVVLIVTAPDADLVCEVRTDQLHRFLARSYAAVPVGTESDHLDLDRLVGQLLTSDAQ